VDKLYWLDQIKLQDRAKVGVQAFDLSKIKQQGYPVLPGFVVEADVLRQFLETLNSSESLIADLPHSSLHLDVHNWRQLQQVAGRLRQEIISATVPPHWVRTIFQAARQWQRSSLILRPSLAISNNQEMKNVSGLLSLTPNPYVPPSPPTLVDVTLTPLPPPLPPNPPREVVLP
jgi:pyruvate,water dikinase